MLLNIHPAYHSSLHSMQLLLVAKVVDIKRYGFDAVIKPVVEDLQRLAKDISTCTCTFVHTRTGVLVVVIARGQGLMAVNRPESEGVARVQGRFTLP